MISMLNGTIAELGGNHAVVDIGGLGYKVFMTADAIHGLKSGAQIKLWTHQAVREDALDLFGFTSEGELQFFEMLISVSGVGPRSALAILDTGPLAELSAAIKEGRPDLLTRAPGIGTA